MTAVTPVAGVSRHARAHPGRSDLARSASRAWTVTGVLPGASIHHAAAGAFRGLAMRALAADGEGDRFALVLVHAELQRSVTVGVFTAEDIVAVWQDYAKAAGLPLLLERPDGDFDPLYPQVGRARLGAIRIRRRHGLLAGRRPRFLVRRKPGRPLERPIVWRKYEMLTKD